MRELSLCRYWIVMGSPNPLQPRNIGQQLHTISLGSCNDNRELCNMQQSTAQVEDGIHSSAVPVGIQLQVTLRLMVKERALPPEESGRAHDRHGMLVDCAFTHHMHFASRMRHAIRGRRRAHHWQAAMRTAASRCTDAALAPRPPLLLVRGNPQNAVRKAVHLTLLRVEVAVSHIVHATRQPGRWVLIGDLRIACWPQPVDVLAKEAAVAG